MKKEEIKWILSLPKEIKLNLLEKMLVENKFGEAFQFQKILLEAPISEGGIATEELNEVFTSTNSSLKEVRPSDPFCNFFVLAFKTELSFGKKTFKEIK